MLVTSRLWEKAPVQQISVRHGGAGFCDLEKMGL